MPRGALVLVLSARLLSLIRASSILEMLIKAAIKSGFCNYLDFTHRAGRAEYWIFVLFVLMCAGLLGNARLNDVFLVAMVLPVASATVRRLHDVGRSGWWLLIWPTGVGALVILFWCAMPGEEGANDYGAAPLLDEEPESALPAGMRALPRNGLVKLESIPLQEGEKILWSFPRVSDFDVAIWVFIFSMLVVGTGNGIEPLEGVFFLFVILALGYLLYHRLFGLVLVTNKHIIEVKAAYGASLWRLHKADQNYEWIPSAGNTLLLAGESDGAMVLADLHYHPLDRLSKISRAGSKLVLSYKPPEDIDEKLGEFLDRIDTSQIVSRIHALVERGLLPPLSIVGDNLELESWFSRAIEMWVKRLVPLASMLLVIVLLPTAHAVFQYEQIKPCRALEARAEDLTKEVYKELTYRHPIRFGIAGAGTRLLSGRNPEEFVSEWVRDRVAKENLERSPIECYGMYAVSVVNEKNIVDEYATQFETAFNL